MATHHHGHEVEEASVDAVQMPALLVAPRLTSRALPCRRGSKENQSTYAQIRNASSIAYRRGWRRRLRTTGSFPRGFLVPLALARCFGACPLPLARRGGVRGPCIRGCLLKLLESCLQGRVKLRKGLCNGAKRLHCWKMMVCGVLVRRVIAGLPIRVFRTWQETGCAEQQRCILRIARCIALPGRLRVVKQLHLFIQNHRQLLQ